MTIALGGNIVLEGFDDRDFTELIVVKKMVGQYARQLSDTVGQIDRFTVTLRTEGEHIEISTRLVLAGNPYLATERAQNLYVALDAALRGVATQARA